ncbi:MAG: hypothetical protein HZB29_13150 [Nitrospinae bacterium]|nr:hypothetical protein [Nitrospinota bacterium]
MKILGLDIGGAHVKSAVTRVNGGRTILGARKIHPFEIFREKERLRQLLKAIKGKAKPDAVALTMTGELADVFKSRAEGVRWIVNAAQDVFCDTPAKVVDVDGNLITPGSALQNPAKAASANWAATAAWVARHVETCLIVDIGSTTTDILPIKNGRPAVKGKTDFQRLRHGELVYTGYLRTNAAMLLRELQVNGSDIPICPEYFSIIGDAHLYLGHIGKSQYTATTPDGGAKTKSAAAKRLARLVLSEPQIIGRSAMAKIASQLVEANINMVAESINHASGRAGFHGAPIVLTGSGAFYKKWLLLRLSNMFMKTVGDAGVEKIDPAACAAALWEKRAPTSEN